MANELGGPLGGSISDHHMRKRVFATWPAGARAPEQDVYRARRILARFSRVQANGSVCMTGRFSGFGSFVARRISGPRLAMSPTNRMLLPTNNMTAVVTTVAPRLTPRMRSWIVGLVSAFSISGQAI